MSETVQSVQADTAPAGGDRPVQKIILPGQTPEGQYILSVLHKRSYDFKHKQTCTRAETDRKCKDEHPMVGIPRNGIA